MKLKYIIGIIIPILIIISLILISTMEVPNKIKQKNINTTINNLTISILSDGLIAAWTFDEDMSETLSNTQPNYNYNAFVYDMHCPNSKCHWSDGQFKKEGSGIEARSNVSEFSDPVLNKKLRSGYTEYSFCLWTNITRQNKYVYWKQWLFNIGDDWVAGERGITLSAETSKDNYYLKNVVGCAEDGSNCFAEIYDEKIKFDYNTLNHFCTTFNRNTISQYANGKLINVQTENKLLGRLPDLSRANTPIIITGYRNTYQGGELGANIIGMIDEIYVWNRTLSQNDIHMLYNNGDGLFYNTNDFN